MTQRSFFGWIWRFNALAIAGVAVIGLLLGSYALYETIRHLFRDRTIHSAARVTEPSGAGTQVREQLSLGGFNRISGTKILRAPIHGDQSYRMSSYSKSASSTRNYVFYNAATGAHHTLLPDDKGIFLQERELHPASKDQNKPPTALFYEVVREDTNKDGILNRKDARELMLVRPDGHGASVIAQNVDDVQGLSMLDHREIVIIFTRKGLTTAGHFSAEDFSQTKLVPINRKSSDEAESSEL